MNLEFRLLGPVEVRADDRVLPLGGARQRSVLAILLLHANQVVPSDRLIDLIWGESPPGTAATALQGYISQLRKVIEPPRPAGATPSVIVTAAPGYIARVEPGQLDLGRFELLVSRGREAAGAGQAQAAADAFRDALALWRGPPLANIRDEPFAQDAIRTLEELRMAAIEDHLEARLALGRHREAVAELESLVAAHPLRERLHAQLMLALYRSDRQAEALEAFAAARRMLVEELGIEPGDSLRRLHQRMLEQDPALAPSMPPVAEAEGSPHPGTHHRWPRRRVIAGALAAAIALAAGALLVGAMDRDSGAADPLPANSLVLLDPDDGSVLETIDVGGTPTSVTVGEGAAWVLNADDQTISRVDAQTHEVRTFGSGGVPTDVAAGAGAVWVGNGRRTRAQFVGPVATSVARLDPSSTAVRDAVTLPAPRGYTSNLQQDHIAVARDAVWVVNPDASVSLIDPRTSELTSVIRGVRAAAVAVGDEGVWALGLDSSLARLDPRTRKVDRRIRLAASTLSAVAVGGGAVWAADPYDGTVWRVDTEPRLVQRTIDVGTGVSDVAYGMGSVWALNSLRGTLTRIDPRTNRVVATVALGNTPRQLAVGAGGVWVTVAGAAGDPLPAAAETEGRWALPASTCGPVFYGGGGTPDLLIVSDMPLRGGRDLPTLQMSEAIAYVLRRRGFRAGRHRVAYQACDDSTAQTGIFDPDKCAANAKLYVETPAVIGVVGPYNSGCAVAQIPLANQASGGPLAMISPTNSDIGLTRSTPTAPEGMLRSLYPTGRRNYARIYPREDVQAAANAIFARDLGARRVAILSDGGYGETQALYFARGARRLDLVIATSLRWAPERRSYRALADSVARARPDAVFLSGLLDTNGGQLIKDLRARLPAETSLLASDGFLPISKLLAAAGRAGRGVHVSLAGLPVERLPREGRHFAAQFGATQSGRRVDPASVYAAQAAEVLLDAVAASDGTRASVVAELRRIRVRRGILGSFGFDANGDATRAPITIVRAQRAGGSGAVASTEGGRVVRVIEAPPG